MYMSGIDQLSGQSPELSNLENPQSFPSSYSPHVLSGDLQVHLPKSTKPPLLVLLCPVSKLLRGLCAEGRHPPHQDTPTASANFLMRTHLTVFSSWQQIDPNKLKNISNTNSSPLSFFFKGKFIFYSIDRVNVGFNHIFSSSIKSTYHKWVHSDLTMTCKRIVARLFVYRLACSKGIIRDEIHQYRDPWILWFQSNKRTRARQASATE